MCIRDRSKDSKRIFYPISDRGDTQIAVLPITGGEPEKFWKAAGQVPLFDIKNNVMVCVLSLIHI